MNSDAPGGSPNDVDLAAFPAAAKLVDRVGEFMQEVQNMYVSSLERSVASVTACLPCTTCSSSLLVNKQNSRQRPRTPPEPRLRTWKPILRRLLLAGEKGDRRRLGCFGRVRREEVSTWQSTCILSFTTSFSLTSPPAQIINLNLPINPLTSHRSPRPVQQPSICPSRPSSSTRRKSTPANTTSTRTARSTVSCRSIRLSNWRVCQLKRIGGERAGRVWHRARIIILVPEVGRELHFSSCPVAGLPTTRSRVSRSRRTSECFCLMIAENVAFPMLL